MSSRRILTMLALSAALNVMLLMFKGMLAGVLEPEEGRAAPRMDPVNVAGASIAGPFDLLRQLDSVSDVVLGAWRKDDSGALISPLVPFARIYLPCVVPEEYDLGLVVERLGGTNSFNVGLSMQGRQVVVAFDGWEEGKYCGLDQVDGKPFFENATTLRRKLLPAGVPRRVHFAVRKSGLSVTLDREVLIAWTQGFERLAPYRKWAVTETRACFLGSWSSSFRVREAVLIPVNGRATAFR